MVVGDSRRCWYKWFLNVAMVSEFSIFTKIEFHSFGHIPWVAAKARWLPCKLKVAGSIPGWGWPDLYCAWGAQWVLPTRGATSQLDLLSLMPLSEAGYGQLQLGAPNWATSVDCCKWFIIDPTFCGSRLSTGRLLAMEDFTADTQTAFCPITVLW